MSNNQAQETYITFNLKNFKLMQKKMVSAFNLRQEYLYQLSMLAFNGAKEAGKGKRDFNEYDWVLSQFIEQRTRPLELNLFDNEEVTASEKSKVLSVLFMYMVKGVMQRNTTKAKKPTKSSFSKIKVDSEQRFTCGDGGSLTLDEDTSEVTWVVDGGKSNREYTRCTPMARAFFDALKVIPVLRLVGSPLPYLNKHH